jgi:hypothetical protein
MPIELNPNSINISSGVNNRPETKARQNEAQPEAGRKAFSPTNLNIIPSDETLQTQVRSALAERREGRVADRGSILNLLV